jgi:hypothetical protein
VDNSVAGTITPSGSVPVDSGEDQTFTISPNDGYYIDDLVVDSSSAGAASSYAFTNVTSNHSIEAQFYTNPAEAESIVNPGDVDGDGIDDIAVLITTESGGKYASIRNATSGDLINNVYFGNSYIANALIAIPDIDASGTQELVFLGKNKTSGAMVAQVVDTDGTFIRNVYFDSNYDLREFMSILDTNSNGKDDLVYLGVHNTNGQHVARVRDAYTGDYIRGIWYDINYDIKGMAFSNTISGNTPELSVLGVHITNGAQISQIKNAADASFVRNVWFNKDYEPQTNGYVALSDVDAEGTYELSTLGIYNGQMISQIKNATGGFVRYVFYDASYSPVDLAVMPNIANAAGYQNSEELALLEQKTGSVQVQVKDAVSGTYINNVSIDSDYTPLGIISVSDQNGDGAADFAVLGRHKYTGARKVFVKDALTGNTIIYIYFPKY